MSHASRFALIAALACKGFAPVKSHTHTYATPARCQGSRVNLADACTTPAERNRLAHEVADLRAARALALPVNFVLVNA